MTELLAYAAGLAVILLAVAGATWLLVTLMRD